jgi:hypothetical protein
MFGCYLKFAERIDANLAEKQVGFIAVQFYPTRLAFVSKANRIGFLLSA